MPESRKRRKLRGALLTASKANQETDCTDECSDPVISDERTRSTHFEQLVRTYAQDYTAFKALGDQVAGSRSHVTTALDANDNSGRAACEHHASSLSTGPTVNTVIDQSDWLYTNTIHTE